MEKSASQNSWKQRRGHEYYFWMMAICWTLLLLFSFFWTRQNATTQVMQLVRVQARTAYEKDVLYRFWNSTHGSVYVPVSDETPPNPYLEAPERDITTPQGVPLTLMNPAYMTRQANELGLKRLGIYGHLTSLKPLRPANAPDPWERQGLLKFEAGEAEVSSVEMMGEKKVLRLMRPLLVEEECLPCHAKQKYQVGEIRGGISVSIDMTPSLVLLRGTQARLLVGHLLLWMTGLGGLLVRSRMLIKRDQERRMAAENLEKINGELEQRVADRTAELKEINRRLREDIRERIAAQAEKERLEGQLRQAQKLEIIGTLSGGIAHDFNNLLTPILGYAELAQGRTEITPELKKDVGRIFNAAERARGLVQQILAFSRRTEQAFVLVSMQQIIREVLELIRPTFPKSISIDVQIPDADLLVEVDPAQMHQVVMNLCTNAWHAMRDTEGVLRLTLEKIPAEALPIKLLEESAKEYACLKVYDSGCGIEEQTQEKIFEPFFTTKKKGEGTGLGLSVVQGIVHSHGGAIGLESAVGQGSCFQVCLPLAEADAEPAETTFLVRGNGQRILLVDDELDILDMLTEGLTKLGFSVTGFSSGRAALDVFQAQPDAFELLLSDRLMPGMSGLQLVVEVRGIRPDLPILFMTGFSDDEADSKIPSLSNVPCLLKPMTVSEVAEQIILQLTAD